MDTTDLGRLSGLDAVARTGGDFVQPVLVDLFEGPRAA
jgi:hypothetical protein